MAKLDELFSRGVSTFVDPNGVFRKSVEAKARGENPNEIIIKFGVDPTRPDLHLGHAVILRKLRAFQDIGCKIVFLVGDYTSMIGDPTGKSKVRPEVSQAEIEVNMKTYLAQVGKILKTDPAVFSWVRNSDWFLNVTDIAPSNPDASIRIGTGLGFVKAGSFLGKAKLFDDTRMQTKQLKRPVAVTVSFSNVLFTLRHLTHARLIERDMFQDRLKNGGELYMHEMLYPVLQGIDSFALANIYGSCALEIGGTDQTFNMLIGRDVMKMNKQPEQAVLSMDIIEGLDGKEKMSKSLDNYVGIADEPNDMYGKIMSIPDSIIAKYFLLATYTPSNEVVEIEKNIKEGLLHPKEAKMRLAREIVAIYHGDKLANDAEKAFSETFREGKIPEDVSEISNESKSNIIAVLVESKCVESKSEARRLVESGAVTFLEKDMKVRDVDFIPEEGTYRVGKHRFFRIKK